MNKNGKEQEIQKIKEEFDKRTAGYRGEDIWDLREYLMLVNLADNAYMGKTQAIIYAYRMGHLDGQKELKDRVMKHFESGKGGAE